MLGAEKSSESIADQEETELNEPSEAVLMRKFCLNPRYLQTSLQKVQIVHQQVNLNLLTSLTPINQHQSIKAPY